MTVIAEETIPRRRGFWWAALGRFARHPRSLAAAGALVALVLACLLVPVISPHDPYEVDFSQKLQGPSPSHPAGTDFFGRDLLERLALGGRTSLEVAGAALALILVLGIGYGAIAATAGGRVDEVMMRVLDGLLAIPRFPVIVIILVIAGLRTNELTLILALAITSWFVVARLVRTELLSLRRREFVRAAHAVGARRRHVLARHLLPNAAGVVVVAALLELPAVILNEAFVSTLGLGLNPPAATWGNLAYEGIRQGRLWEVLLPSIAIAIFAVSANLVADGLDDAFDPRRSSSR
ncbi:MAG TPA: ABC transporter permease [Gaiellaceae bacterium]|nr:ABC transporter permease [Gaiellaceae bacterium]